MFSLRILAAVGAVALAVPVALALPGAPVAAQAASPLDQAVAALRGISTLQADFVQTDRTGRAARGALTLKRPGRIRFEYARGENLLIVGDGRALTMIDYEVCHVQRWPIGNSPLGALFDPNRDVKRFGKLMPTADPNVISVEVKDPSKPEYGTITLIFVRKGDAPGGFELNSWVALDAQNNRTTVRLSNQRYGMTVADSSFRFRDCRRSGRRP